MNKEDLIMQANKIYQALNTISVRGYGDIKTLGNCLDAMQELAKNITSYENDVQNAIKKQIEDTMESVYKDDGVVPTDIPKPKPERIKKEVNNIGEN